MIRLIAILVGLGFGGVALISLLFGIGPAFSTLAEHGRFVAPTAEHEFHEEAHAPQGGFSFAGPAGRWDEAQLQRGYQVYKEVCAACHGLKYVAFRDLGQLGYTEGQVKALAAEWTVPGVDPDTGEATTRPGQPTDFFPSPYPNAIAAAAANNNAIPPDLSLITKARKNGSEYVYSLLTGYRAAPAELAREFPEFEVGPGLHYNPYFKSLALAMAPPISTNGQVTYADGAPAPTIQQMSHDVTAFLTWAGEPKLEQRRQTGVAVIIFLLFATILAYLSKKQIWSAVKPRRED
jgi:ubiquinol-cytochrome c reductase cytochrome c1 subunit